MKQRIKNMSSTLDESPCVQRIMKYIQPYIKKRQHLILSSEELSMYHSKIWGNNNSQYRYLYGPNSHPTILDWISLYSILKNYYRITVIVTYRRYYDWLPSAKQQIERWHIGKPSLNQWPKYSDNPMNSIRIVMNDIMNQSSHDTTTNNSAIIQYLSRNIIQNSKWEGSNSDIEGRNIEPIFPHWWKTNFPPGATDDMPHYYMDSVIRSIDQVNHMVRSNRHNNKMMNSSSMTTKTTSSSKLIHIIVMNMHAKTSLSSNSYNHNNTNNSIILRTNYTRSVRSLFFCSIPAATRLCQYSQYMDNVEQEDQRNQNTNNGELYVNQRQTTSYYELVIHAARYGFINIVQYQKYRHIIGTLAKEYHHSLLLLSTRNKVSASTSSSLKNSSYIVDDDNQIGWDVNQADA